MTAQRLLLPSLLALTVAGCNCHSVSGSGTAKTDERQVGPYHRVAVAGALDVKLVDRPWGTVVVTGDDNLVDLVETTVVEGVLRVAPKDEAGALLPKIGLEIEVSLQHVDEVGVSGASKVSASAPLQCDRIALAASEASQLELDAVVGSQLVLWASGSSHVKVRDAAAAKTEFKVSGSSKVEVKTGQLAAIDAEVSGSSELQLGEAVAQTATLNVSGSSLVNLSATQGVSGSVSGASSVNVNGKPAAQGLESSGSSIVTYGE